MSEKRARAERVAEINQIYQNIVGTAEYHETAERVVNEVVPIMKGFFQIDDPKFGKIARSLIHNPYKSTIGKQVLNTLTVFHAIPAVNMQRICDSLLGDFRREGVDEYQLEQILRETENIHTYLQIQDTIFRTAECQRMSCSTASRLVLPTPHRYFNYRLLGEKAVLDIVETGISHEQVCDAETVTDAVKTMLQRAVFDSFKETARNIMPWEITEEANQIYEKEASYQNN